MVRAEKRRTIIITPAVMRMIWPRSFVEGRSRGLKKRIGHSILIVVEDDMGKGSGTVPPDSVLSRGPSGDMKLWS
jgi:hypothetical protein